MPILSDTLGCSLSWFADGIHRSSCSSGKWGCEAGTVYGEALDSQGIPRVWRAEDSEGEQVGGSRGFKTEEAARAAIEALHYEACAFTLAQPFKARVIETLRGAILTFFPLQKKAKLQEGVLSDALALLAAENLIKTGRAANGEATYQLA